MNETAVLIAIAVFVFACGYAAYYFGTRKKAGAKKPKSSITPPESIEFAQPSPKGVLIQSYKLITPNDFAKLAPVVDMGISNLIRATRSTMPNWTNKLNHSEYKILFIKSDSTHPLTGTPELLIHGTPSAGTVIGVANDGLSPATIVLPYQENWNYLTYLMYSVFNEGEHYLEWFNDKDEFYKYAVAADVHPHRPMPDGLEIEMPTQAVGFAGAPKATVPRCSFGKGMHV